MNKPVYVFIFFVFALFLNNCVAEESERSLNRVYESEENLNILVPEEIYSVEGMPLDIFFDNLILSDDSDKYKYEILINGKKRGRVYRRKWVFYPLKDDLGKNQLEIKIINPQTNDKKSSVITTLLVASKDKKTKAKILSIGDSLGHQSRFPSRLYELFKLKGEEKNIEFLGSHFPKGSLVKHEHNGGWTWQKFITFYQPGKENIHHASKSPFVFVNDKTNLPELNFSEYIYKTLKGEKPDIIIILLGINDAWTLDIDNPAIFEKGLENIINNAHRLVNDIITVIPDVKIGIGMVIPANYSKRSFQDIYQDSTSPWRWKRINYALNAFYLKAFTSNKNVTILPTHLGVDTIEHYNSHKFIPDKVGYSVSHVVHPNSEGDMAIAKVLYYWVENIKWE